MFIYSFHWLGQRLEKDVETSFQFKNSSVVEHLSFPYSRAELYIFSEFLSSFCFFNCCALNVITKYLRYTVPFNSLRLVKMFSYYRIILVFSKAVLNWSKVIVKTIYNVTDVFYFKRFPSVAQLFSTLIIRNYILQWIKTKKKLF